MNRYLNIKYYAEAVKKDVILNLFQNLHSLFKLGDAGSGSGMTKLSLLAYLILFAPPAIAQENSIRWEPFEETIQLAEEKQKPILVDVWAPWCGWCKKMQKEVYPALSENLAQEFIWTRLNRDDHETALQFKNQTFTPLRLAQQLNVQSVPALVFLSPEGEYIFHISGFVESQKLSSILEDIALATTNGSQFSDKKSKQKNK